MQQPGSKRELGGHRFQMGGWAPLAPPLATALGPCPGQANKKSRLGIQSGIMNHIWSDNRNRMLEHNVKALITCKINTDFSWCDFYEKIQSNKDFLKKVLSTEKYDWTNE